MVWRILFSRISKISLFPKLSEIYIYMLYLVGLEIVGLGEMDDGW